MKRIAVFTSGGDSPGMNAALFGVVKKAEELKIKVFGIKYGYKGMISGAFTSLKSSELQNEISLGGTRLKTARSEDFKSLAGRKKALNQLYKFDIDGLIAIGGDGTIKGLDIFSNISEIPCVAIPGTIDNDLNGTDFSLGFNTAVNTAVENIDKIRDTAESHCRVFIIEVMGRRSGFIAAYSGIGTGADAILIPELSLDTEKMLKKIHAFNPNEAFIIILSEGDEKRMNELQTLITRGRPELDIRKMVLGHIQRGGSPSAFDRTLGIQLGMRSVEALYKNQNKVMVGITSNTITINPFEEVLKKHHIPSSIIRIVNTLNQ